jgi:broad specificity phosphatase PhoE
MVVQRVLIMRHGDRYSGAHDPELTPIGHEQAQQLARLLADEDITAIYCSPFIRSLQTAAPIAAARGQLLTVDRGFGEIMPERSGNPLPHLLYDSRRDSLPHVPTALLAPDSGSPVPEYPDISGPGYYRQGDVEQRQPTVDRHAAALERAFAAVTASHHSTILVVGHGCSSDFCCSALLSERFPAAFHTGGRTYWPAARGRPADGLNQPAPPHVRAHPPRVLIRCADDGVRRPRSSCSLRHCSE